MTCSCIVSAIFYLVLPASVVLTVFTALVANEALCG